MEREEQEERVPAARWVGSVRRGPHQITLLSKKGQFKYERQGEPDPRGSNEHEEAKVDSLTEGSLIWWDR
jgi:hypothetical protein